MRIISGKFRGRKLKAFKASWIRPTTDRVKETLFNKIQGFLPGASVLDLFAGTGNLSLEALSRGAAKVTSVESHAGSIRIIKDNLREFGVRDEIEVVKKDVRSFLKGSCAEKYDLILIDPPFTESMADEVMTLLMGSDFYHADVMVAIESSKHETIQDTYGDLELLSRKNFGDKDLSIYTGAGDEES